MRRPDLGIVAMVPDRWNTYSTTRHHILQRLADRFEVAWVEPALGWREHWMRAASTADETGQLQIGHPHLRIVPSSRWLPDVYRPAALRSWLIARRLALATRRLRERGARRVALYLWRPEFAAAAAVAGFDFRAYHIDDDYAFSTTEQPISAVETALIRGVDQVFVHSPRLLRKKGGLNPNTELVPNGVDFRAFAQPRAEAPDLRPIPHPRVGYIGVVKKQLDFGLLLELARRRPEWSFVFVGPVGVLGDKTALWRSLEALPNVHALGGRPARELPAYAQHFDVAQMAYEVNDYTNSISPLKLNEYLATGRPAVSSRIESVLPFESVLPLPTGTDAWEAALAAALTTEARNEEAVARRQAMARSHDWDALVVRVAALFEKGLSRSAV
jgi:glycosyltransferase involved in cell wall biosynthesis